MKTRTPSKLERLLWPIVYIVSPIVPIAVYFAGNWASVLHSWSLSMLFGIVAYTWFLNQFIVAARPGYWDRLYGLDRMYRFHGTMALWGAAFVVAHMVMKWLDYGFVTLQIALGLGAVALFLGVIAVTVVFMVRQRILILRPIDRLRRLAARRQRWQYQSLRRFHNLVGVAALLSLAHVLLAFSTRESYARIAVMAAWFLVAAVFYGWHKVLRPAKARRCAYTVADVVRENGVVTRVDLAPPPGTQLGQRAGQFAYFRFLDAVPGPEEHPFTISSAPINGTVSFTAKNLGDFTGNLAQVQPGARVAIDGPYGIFRLDRAQAGRPIVMIAGGIGVTPFLSMLDLLRHQAVNDDQTEDESVRSDQRTIHLLWSCRTQDEFFALDRIVAATESLSGLAVHLFCTGKTDAAAVPGITESLGGIRHGQRITINSLRELGLVSGLAEYYLCGPGPMMESIVTGLRQGHVRGTRIHFEAFAM